MKEVIHIEMEQEMIKNLDEYAKELDKSRTTLIEKALELYFDRLDEIIADKRIDEIKKTNAKLIPLEEVFKEAGLDV